MIQRRKSAFVLPSEFLATKFALIARTSQMLRTAPKPVIDAYYAGYTLIKFLPDGRRWCDADNFLNITPPGWYSYSIKKYSAVTGQMFEFEVVHFVCDTSGNKKFQTIIEDNAAGH